jgi:hypothetical protein
MVFLKQWFKCVVLVLLLSILAACSQSGPSVSAEIDGDLGWVIGNIPANYWSDGSGPSAVIDLSFVFQDPNISLATIESVKISNSLAPSRGWTYTTDELSDHFFTSATTGKKGFSFFNLWTDELSSNGSAIYLGTYTVEVELKNGRGSSKTLVTPAPNALTANGYSYAYSPESYAGTPTANYVALPKRATIESAAFNTTGDTLTLNFLVNDDRVYNGVVEFFDVNGDYLGFAGTFRDFETKSLYPKLNGGLELRNNGTSNNLILSSGDIVVSSRISNFSLAMIKSFNVILMDGKQYVGTKGMYDTYSYSLGTVN